MCFSFLILETIMGIRQFIGETGFSLTEGKIKQTHDSEHRLPPEEKFKHFSYSLITCRPVLGDSCEAWTLYDWSWTTCSAVVDVVNGRNKKIFPNMLHIMVKMQSVTHFSKPSLCDLLNVACEFCPNNPSRHIKKGTKERQ